jgi:signal transduction histidine kinase
MNRLLALAICLISFALHSQPSSELDSLKAILKTKNLSGDSKIKTQIGLSNYYSSTSPAIAIAYIDSSLTLANGSSQYSKYLSELYLLKGSLLGKQSIYEEAITYYKKGLQYAIESGDKLTEAKFYINLANIADENGDLTEALKLCQKATDISITLKDTFGLAQVYNSTGLIYWEKDDDKAFAYLRKAIALNRSAGDNKLNSRLYNNIGLIFMGKDQCDSALVYYKKALSYTDVKKDKYGLALINNNIGVCYQNSKQYDSALYYFSITKDIQTEINDQYGLALVNENISIIYFEKRQYAESLIFLKKAQEYAKKINNLEVLHEISEDMARTYEKLGDFKSAFLNQKQTEIYDDSLHKNSLNKEIAELEVKYKVKQQVAENDLLKTKNELQLSTIRNKDFYIIAGVIFTILILTLLALVYRSLHLNKRVNSIIKEKNKKLQSLNKEVEKQNASIEEQKDEIISQNEELYKKNQFLEELNQEKNSLMGIVAHDLKSPLNSIGGIVSALHLVGDLNSEQKDFIGLINNVLENSIVLIRNLIDLSALENKEMKADLETVSVTEILSECHSKFMPQAMQKNISLTIFENIDPNVKILSDAAYLERILQNLISNSLKFSQPGTQIILGAKVYFNQIQIYVKDNGPGISEQDKKSLFKKFQKLTARPTKGESSSGLGLSIVKGLVEELKGTIQVDSELGKGSTFTCSLPL